MTHTDNHNFFFRKPLRAAGAIFMASITAALLFSCTSDKTTKRRQSMFTPSSTGAPYEVLVVGSPADFTTGVMDSIKYLLEDEVLYIPQSEKSFNVSRVSSNDFDKSLKFCRNIIMLKIDKIYSHGKITFSRDVYSSPQVIMNIQAGNAAQFKEFVAENKQQILRFLTRVELNNQIDYLREKHNTNVQSRVKELFGYDIWVPSELDKFKNGKNFYMATTDRGSKDMYFVIYTYPYRDRDTFTKEYFMAKRDSVMKANLPGPRENSYMSTFHPLVGVEDTEVGGGYAQVARGLWEMVNYDMGGPFVSVSRVDEVNQLVVVTEGFVYAPGDPKRNLIRNLEAALYTLALPQKKSVPQLSYALDEIEITANSQDN